MRLDASIFFVYLPWWVWPSQTTVDQASEPRKQKTVSRTFQMKFTNELIYLIHYLYNKLGINFVTYDSL